MWNCSHLFHLTCGQDRLKPLRQMLHNRTIKHGAMPVRIPADRKPFHLYGRFVGALLDAGSKAMAQVA